MKLSKIVLASVVLICLATIIWFGFNFAPGSYPFVKEYQFNVSEAELIDDINKLREMDPSLKVPDNHKMVEGRRGENDHWHHFYIYYSDEQAILNCWLRTSSARRTNLAFVAIRTKNGKWESVEEDFSLSESKEQYKKFEERFIRKLQKITEM